MSQLPIHDQQFFSMMEEWIGQSPENLQRLYKYLFLKHNKAFNKINKFESESLLLDDCLSILCDDEPDGYFLNESGIIRLQKEIAKTQI